ncbi:MAG: cytochrome c oxidase assembly protein [Betaproteobacteria bacterium]
MSETVPRRDHAPLIRRLLLLVAAASVFGFGLVPLYNVLCEATGFNGKTGGGKEGFGIGGLAAAIAAPAPAIDRSRLVTVDFTGTVMPGLPWQIRPLTPSLDTHPGDMQQVRFLVSNTSDRTIVGQAVPSVTPGQAAKHFQKIECFCFTQQTLAPGEAREMPLVFIVKPGLDPDIRNITLSYSFYSLETPPLAMASREVR